MNEWTYPVYENWAQHLRSVVVHIDEELPGPQTGQNKRNNLV